MRLNYLRLCTSKIGGSMIRLEYGHAVGTFVLKVKNK